MTRRGGGAFRNICAVQNKKGNEIIPTFQNLHTVPKRDIFETSYNELECKRETTYKIEAKIWSPLGFIFALETKKSPYS